jgi:hypothetical protein
LLVNAVTISGDRKNAEPLDQLWNVISANRPEACDLLACRIDRIGDDRLVRLPRLGSYRNIAVDVILR